MKKRQKRWMIRFFKFTRFNNFSLQKKLLCTHVLLLIIPLISLSFFFFFTYMNDKEAEMVNIIQKVNAQVVGGVDEYIIQLKSLTLQPLYDEFTIPLLYEKLYKEEMEKGGVPKASTVSNTLPGTQHTIPSQDNTARGFEWSEANKISAMISRIMAFNSNISSIFIYDVSGNYIYQMTDNHYLIPENPQNQPWFRECLDKDGSTVFISSIKYEDYNRTKKDDRYFFYIARAIYDINSNKSVGIISIGTDVKYLRDTCNRIKSLKDEHIFIVDTKGNIVYCTMEDRIGQNINSGDFIMQGLTREDPEKGFAYTEYGGKRHLVVSSASGKSGLSIMRVIPEESFYKDIWTIRDRFFAIIILFTMLSLVFSIWIAYGITKPLKKLMISMKLVQKGDLSVRFRARYKDEVGVLGRSFNKMIKEIDNLVNIVHHAQLRERETELNALQAQINPHFLYNTLESIRRMAEINGDVESARMTFVLGKLMRYSISIKNKFVTVREEIMHLENYIVLQNYRLGNRLELTNNIPDEFYDVEIIRLVFQPIVENSIFHGIEAVNNNVIITISGCRIDNTIQFEITDNGTGIAQEKLEKLTKSINDFSCAENGERGVGLRNINERIKLLYGDAYGIEISSTNGTGTTVRIVLPDNGNRAFVKPIQ